MFETARGAGMAPGVLLAQAVAPAPYAPASWTACGTGGSMFLAFALLLALLPSMRVTAYTCQAVGAMLFVFAIWAATGFAYPAQPVPLALNVVSKLLCFVAALTLFVWREDRSMVPAPLV